ncbi:hypothetical protein DRO03_11945 [Methanosarcinales archaeon]|nr:MAG: hypothetical protein DRO03_11945 [Methanosarcinales archaeon]
MGKSVLRENMQTASNKKGLLGRQTHLLRLLHPNGMADEYRLYIIIGFFCQGLIKKRNIFSSS